MVYLLALIIFVFFQFVVVHIMEVDLAGVGFIIILIAANFVLIAFPIWMIYTMIYSGWSYLA